MGGESESRRDGCPCVLTRGHYSVSIADKTYQVIRIWIHPEFSPEFLYLALFKEEFDHDVAILQIAQQSFSVDKYEHLKDKALLPGAGLFAVRSNSPDRQNSSEIEELAYANLEFTKKGVTISNNGKAYDICPGDSGTPLFARIGDARVIIGIIVGNAPLGQMRSEEFCGNEIRVIDATVILEFLQFVRQRSK